MKLVLLMSGGIDSPVAGYMMTRQGHELHAVHFSQEPITDDAAEKKSLKLSKMVGCKSFCVYKIGEELAKIASVCDPKYYFVLQKRLFMKLASEFAKTVSAEGLVTGESVGQVSSQTLVNLVNITKGVEMPIVRPLLGFNKSEIIKLAEKIGTFETSKGPELCALLGPNHPSTSTWFKKVIDEELKIYPSVLESAREKMSVVEI